MTVQIAQCGVVDTRVLAVMREIPRHRFVPELCVAEAYGDFPLPIKEGQTISQPLIVGLMSQLLELEGGEHVLEVGTGSGYQTAVLAQLCRQVVTVERHASLSLEAQDRIRSIGIDNVLYVLGDGTEGYPPKAPYDAIMVTAGAPQIVPPPLLTELASGGRLVIPLGSPRCQELTVFTKREDGTLDQRTHGDCLFVPLIGKFGWDGEALKN